MLHYVALRNSNSSIPITDAVVQDIFTIPHPATAAIPEPAALGLRLPQTNLAYIVRQPITCEPASNTGWD